MCNGVIFFCLCIHLGHFCVVDCEQFVYYQFHGIILNDLVWLLPIVNFHPYPLKSVSNVCFKIPECMFQQFWGSGIDVSTEVWPSLRVAAPLNLGAVSACELRFQGEDQLLWLIKCGGDRRKVKP